MNTRPLVLFLVGLASAFAATAALACDSSPTQTPTASVPNTPLAQPTPTETLTAAQLVTPTPLPTLAPSAPITASSNGYTVTLYPVSADASRVLITYTLTAPPGHNPAATYLTNGIGQEWGSIGRTLVVNDNTLLWARSTTVSFSEFDDPAAPQFPASSTKAIAFDRTRHANDTSALKLHLNSNLVAVKGMTWTYSFSSDPVVETVAHDLNFDFTLPLSRYRRIADANQTSHAGGISLTLDRVAVAPSETLLYMHGSKDPDTSLIPSYLPLVRPDDLQIDTGDRQLSTSTRAGDYPLGGLHVEQTGGDHWILSCPGSLLQSKGRWTLVVRQVVVGENDIGGTYEGPWTFHFTLPDPVEDSAALVTP